MTVRDSVAFLLCSSSALVAGFLFYRWIAVGGGIEIILLGPLLIGLTVAAFLLPADVKWFGLPRPVRGMAYWLLAVAIAVALTGILYGSRNLSRTVLVADFYWDDGVEIYFRADGTFRAIEQHMIGLEHKYGRYRVEGGTIILEKNPVMLGISPFPDTLVYTNRGLHFWLDDESLTIRHGMMSVSRNRLFKKYTQPGRLD